MNATRRDLESQFNRVVNNGWLVMFQVQSLRAKTTTAHLLAIGSRETNLKNIRGDYRGGQYHGFGVMQVDIGTDAAYARNWTPENVEPSIRRGVDIYLSKTLDTQRSIGKRTTVKSRSFIGTEIDAEDLRRIATAAYNCGRWAYYHFSRGQNVDSTTTGKDYSRDVYDRAVVFAEILEERGLEKMAINRELRLQGKYARRAHLEQYNFDNDISDRVKLPAGETQEAQDELSMAEYGRDFSDEPIDFFAIKRYQPLEGITDEEIDGLGANIGSTAEEPAGSQDESLSILTNNGDPLAPPVEAPNAEAGTSPGADSPPPPANEPLGDAPDVAPSHFFSIEDWKPWAIRWVSRIWKGFGTVTGMGGTGLTLGAFNDSGNWHIYAIIGGVLLVLIIGVAFLATVVIAGIWLWQNRGIPAAKQEVMRIAADPTLKNVGIQFVKK